jgi:hypothetical protein
MHAGDFQCRLLLLLLAEEVCTAEQYKQLARHGSGHLGTQPSPGPFNIILLGSGREVVQAGPSLSLAGCYMV